MTAKPLSDRAGDAGIALALWPMDAAARLPLSKPARFVLMLLATPLCGITLPLSFPHLAVALVAAMWESFEESA